MSYRTILAATDFSPLANEALGHAVRLAKQGQSTLHLIHVWEVPVFVTPAGGMPLTPDVAAIVEERGETQLGELAATLSKEGMAVQTHLEQGDAWRTIVDKAKSIDADLIVLGTHGRRGLPRALLGSVAERVVRTSNCPVLVVHEGDKSTAT